MNRYVKVCCTFLLLLITPLNSYSQDTCSIFIHGYTANGEGYFGDVPREVIWDSAKPVEESSIEVARKILIQMETCESHKRVILRPHSYGAAQVLYILGSGKRFQQLKPDHDFVKVYKRTFSVYSYTGAYHGTPLMDLICSNSLMRWIGASFGKSCVKSLLTSKNSDVTSMVNSPGVPTYLIHSTNRSGYFGSLGAVLSKYMVPMFSYFFRGVRNQNDNTLPISSTRACGTVAPMTSTNSNCKKLDSNYFVDYYHEKDRHHMGFLLDKEFMYMGSVNED